MTSCLTVTSKEMTKTMNNYHVVDSNKKLQAQLESEVEKANCTIKHVPSSHPIGPSRHSSKKKKKRGKKSLQCIFLAFVAMFLTSTAFFQTWIWYLRNKDFLSLEASIWDNLHHNDTISPSCILIESKPKVTIDATYKCTDPDVSKKKPKLTVDILSIGSQRRLDKMKTQQNTWASHKSVRTFWGLSEVDDGNIECWSKPNKTKMKEYVEHCKNRKNAGNRVAIIFRERHFSVDMLGHKGNPNGWLCAQRRPGYALGKRGKAYRADALKYGVDAALPDYMILMDDDTYVNMELFTNYMKDKDPSIPLAYAGCITLNPFMIEKRKVMWAYPWGGFGLILSRGSLERMVHPLYCDNRTNTETEWNQFESLVCSRIQDNINGEKNLFRPGMSVSDLAYTIALKKYYCMHSDWLSGYLVNYYYLSELVPNKPYRMHKYLGMQNCANNGDGKCNATSHICHKQSIKTMTNISVDVMKEFPSMYRNSKDEVLK